MRGAGAEEKADRRRASRGGWRHASHSSDELPVGHRILVADDNEDSRDYLAVMLEMAGHTVEVASDGAEALLVAERFRPEVMLLDIQMPKLTGIDVCMRIRSSAWGKDVAIYAVTGLARTEDFQRTRHSGFDGHLVKPVDPALVKSLVMRPPTGPAGDQ